VQTAVPIWLAETVSVFGAACKTKLEGPGEPEEAIRAPLESLLTTVGSQMGLRVVPYGPGLRICAKGPTGLRRREGWRRSVVLNFTTARPR
jgi:hypothetical protein